MRETALTLRILRGVSNARNAISNARNVGRVVAGGPADRAARVVQLTVTSYNVIQYSGCLAWRVYKL
jgi:hypothetical protein